MLRGIAPAMRQPGDKNLLALLAASVIAIGLFYGAGLFYGERTHLSVMEYWRWWVVHLWVEGFFEVFATAALAFIFCSMGLVSRTMATAATLASASLFMLGGVPGDRKSTRLNSSHVAISYAVFCLKKKTKIRSACSRDYRIYP